MIKVIEGFLVDPKKVHRKKKNRGRKREERKISLVTDWPKKPKIER